MQEPRGVLYKYVYSTAICYLHCYINAIYAIMLYAIMLYATGATGSGVNCPSYIIVNVTTAGLICTANCRTDAWGTGTAGFDKTVCFTPHHYSPCIITLINSLISSSSSSSCTLRQKTKQNKKTITPYSYP